MIDSGTSSWFDARLVLDVHRYDEITNKNIDVYRLNSSVTDWQTACLLIWPQVRFEISKLLISS